MKNTITGFIKYIIPLLLLLPLCCMSQGVLLTGPFNVSVCAPLSASFHVQADSGSGNYTYLWYRNNMVTNNNTDTYAINQTDTSMNGDTFYCVVGDLGVSYTSATASLVVINCNIQPLQADAGMTTGVCDSSCIQFNPLVSGGVPPYNYHWTPSGGFNNPVFDPYQPSPQVCYYDSVLTQTLYLTYVLTVTDSIGNSASDSLLITVYPRPQVDAGNDTLIAQNSQVQLNAVVTVASPPWYFIWTPSVGLSDAFLANPVASPVQTTTYTVTVSSNAGCTATDKITVYVAAPVYHNLGGQVFAGLYPVDMGNAALTVVNGNYMNQAGWMTFDTLGYFYFPQQIEAGYYVKCEPATASSAFGYYAPTYYGDVLNWTNATIINLNSDLYNEDIHLISIPGPSPGNGTLGGNVFSSAKNDPLSQAEIMLKDSLGNLLSYNNTDTWGHFEFRDIAYGTYMLFPEIAGKTANPVSVTINATTPDVTNIVFTVNEHSITSAIHENENADVFSAGPLYPVPATETVCMNFTAAAPVTVSIDIVSLAGQIVYTTTETVSSDQRLTLQLNGLMPGVYYIIVKSEKNIITRKLVKL